MGIISSFQNQNIFAESFSNKFNFFKDVKR